ncbi:MAG: YceI family protein [Sediminibacterium sp.]
MKKLINGLFTAILMCAGTGLQAQYYTPVDNGSMVKFTIKNFGINATGTFTGLQGTIRFNPSDPANASFNVSADANTIDTHIAARDNHLRKEEYLAVKRFPRISFVSKQVVAVGTAGEFRMIGIIEIKGVHKEISFPFHQEMQNNGILFTGSFNLNREDFKVGHSSMVMSDNLNVNLTVFARKNK